MPSAAATSASVPSVVLDLSDANSRRMIAGRPGLRAPTGQSTARRHVDVSPLENRLNRPTTVEAARIQTQGGLKTCWETTTSPGESRDAILSSLFPFCGASCPQFTRVLSQCLPSFVPTCRSPGPTTRPSSRSCPSPSATAAPALSHPTAPERALCSSWSPANTGPPLDRSPSTAHSATCRRRCRSSRTAAWPTCSAWPPSSRR